MGAPRDGALGRLLAEAGARVVASVSTTSTMLVVSADHPYGNYYHASPAYRRVPELREKGCTIEIVKESDLKEQVRLAAEIA